MINAATLLCKQTTCKRDSSTTAANDLLNLIETRDGQTCGARWTVAPPDPEDQSMTMMNRQASN